MIVSKNILTKPPGNGTINKAFIYTEGKNIVNIFISTANLYHIPFETALRIYKITGKCRNNYFD